MPKGGDSYQVVYVDGDVPQLPIQLGQLLVDSSQILPGTTNLQQCTSQSPVTYEPIQGSYPATPAEIAAGVIIVYGIYEPGDVRRYGASFGGNATTNRIAIQAALDSNQRARVKGAGTMLLDDTLYFNGGTNPAEAGNLLIGDGLGTILQWNVTGRSLIRARGVDTEGRKYNMGIRDLTIDGTSRANAGVTGIDLKNWNTSDFYNMTVSNCELLMYGYGVTDPPDGALYLRFFKCVFSSAVTLVKLGTLCNSVHFFGCRFNDAVDALVGDDNTENACHGCQFEAITGTAIKLGSAAVCQYYYFSLPRIENTNNAFDLDAANCQSCTIVGPQLTAISGASFVASGSDTAILSGERNSPELRANRFTFGQGALDNSQWATMYASAAGAVSLRNGPDSAYADLDVKLANIRGSAQLLGAATNPGAGNISLGNGTASTVGAAGGASALPATPLGYWTINVGGTSAKVPYYSV